MAAEETSADKAAPATNVQPDAPAAPQADTQASALDMQNDAPAEGKSSGRAAVTVSQGKSDRLLEIEEKLKSNVLSVDERAKLMDEKKQLESEAQGETNEKKDNDRRKKKTEPKKFEEDDIIKYMYNKWLLAMFCWAGAKIEDAIGNAYERAKTRNLNAKERKAARDEKFKKTNAFKTYQSIKDMQRQASDNITSRDKKKLEEIKRLAQVIGEGKMTSASASDLMALCNHLGVPAAEAQNNEQINEIVQKSLNLQEKKKAAYETLGITAEQVEQNPDLYSEKMKELEKNKDQQAKYELAKQQHKEILKAKTELCKVGARFALQEARKVVFNSRLDKTAVNSAAATMLDTVARDGNAFVGKDLKEAFSAAIETQRQTLQKATAHERDMFIDGKEVKTNPDGSKASRKSSIGHYNKMARRAYAKAQNTIVNKKVQEMGEKVPTNKRLGKLGERITKQLKTQQPQTEEEIAQSDQEMLEEDKEMVQSQPEEPAPQKQTEGNKDLQQEASDQKKNEENLRQQQASVREKQAELQAREEKHNNSPTKQRIANFLKNKNKNKNKEHNYEREIKGILKDTKHSLNKMTRQMQSSRI